MEPSFLTSCVAQETPPREECPLLMKQRLHLSRFQRYVAGKALWFVGAFWLALLLNFLLPRLIPGNPVDGIVARLATGGMSGQSLRDAYESYSAQFGLDRPMFVQFLLYVQGLTHGDLGRSFGMYPATVS